MLQFCAIITAQLFDFITREQFALSIVVLVPVFVINQLLSNSQVKNRFVFLQLALDLLVAFILIFLNGGFRNPLYLTMVLNIILAPFFLNRRDSFLFFLYASSLILALSLSPYQFNIERSSFLSENSIAISLLLIGIVIWQLANWLVRELAKLSRQMENLHSYAERIDKYRSLGLLTAGICHQLGTPLNTIGMRLKRLEKGLEQHEQLDDVVIARRNLDKCSEALKKLNTQVHDAEEQFYSQPSQIHTLLRQVIVEYQKDKLLVFELDELESDEILVTFPPMLLARSLLDIFDNALEAGATQVKIKTRIGKPKETSPRYLEVSIHDNGSGFSTEVLSHLGAPFVTSKEYGTGLGIYHLKNAVNYIGGEIFFENLSLGASLKLLLPIKDRE